MHKRKAQLAARQARTAATTPSPLSRVTPATLLRILDAHTRLHVGTALARCGAELYCVDTDNDADADTNNSSSNAPGVPSTPTGTPPRFYGVRVNTSGTLAHIVSTGGPQLLCTLAAAVRIDGGSDASATEAAAALRAGAVPRELVGLERAVYMRVPVAAVARGLLCRPARPSAAAATLGVPSTAAPTLALDALIETVRSTATPIDYGGHALCMLEPERERAAALWRALSCAERRHVLEARACLAVDLSLVNTSLDLFAVHAAIAACFELTDMELLCVWSTEVLHIDAAELARHLASLASIDDVLDYGNTALAPAAGARLGRSALWRAVVRKEAAARAAAEENIATLGQPSTAAAAAAAAATLGGPSTAAAAAPSTAAAATLGHPSTAEARDFADTDADSDADSCASDSQSTESSSGSGSGSSSIEVETLDDARSAFISTMAQAYASISPVDDDGGYSAAHSVLARCAGDDDNDAADSADDALIAEEFVLLGWVHIRKAIMDTFVQSFVHLASTLETVIVEREHAAAMVLGWPSAAAAAAATLGQPSTAATLGSPSTAATLGSPSTAPALSRSARRQQAARAAARTVAAGRRAAEPPSTAGEKSSTARAAATLGVPSTATLGEPSTAGPPAGPAAPLNGAAASGGPSSGAGPVLPCSAGGLFIAEAIYDARACRACNDRTHTCDVVLMPCRDLAVCGACAPLVHVCPACSAPVLDRIHINGV